MTQQIRIQDIAQYDGQEVMLKGWVYNRTGKGRLQFIQLRDGTGVVQCVAFKKEMDEDEFALAKTLSQELPVIATRAPERRIAPPRLST